MTHLKVAVRIRPLSRRETENSCTSILSVDEDNTLSITNPKVPEQNAGDSRERIRRFTFDFCFHENSTQEDVFQAVESVVSKAISQRYHTCVLAYGQSSSGKTHTMMGFPHDPGLTPRLCQKIFNYLEETAVGDELSMKLAVSYLEIYNEKVRDLLQPGDSASASGSCLKVRQHPKKGPYVQGLTEHPVTESSTLFHLLEVGNANRRVASTVTNPQSSRSHSVFLITCSGVKLTLVDLAGSERAGTRCYSTSRFREGANINKSLVALGNVISALAEQSCKVPKGIRRRFIPYRDSVLTWLLKDTLGGNSNTVMIATISPSNTCYSETVNTLRFGQRAKLIVSTPVVNEDPKEKTIRELRAEIVRLKNLLNSTQVQSITLMSNDKQNNESNSPNNLSSSSSKDSILTYQSTETLIPIMNSSASVTKESKPTPRLRRILSVDNSLAAPGLQMENSRQFSSQETLGTNKTRKMPLNLSQNSLRRRSVDKSIPVKKILESPVRKVEKSIGTESKSFLNVTPKVDSIRKTPPKPRSQIVAAVTHRLYMKTKKKEVGTDTSDIATIDTTPKELTICSNARLRLKELTKKVMKAHKQRDIETQTDLFPVLRVKEVSTDVNDLRLELKEIKDIEVSSVVDTEDKSVECTFVENFNDSNFFKNAFVVTNSCGCQTLPDIPETPATTTTNTKDYPTISFSKYLCNPKPQVEIINPNTASPIYTNLVNINISHNCGNHKEIDNSVSDDSIDGGMRRNVCFPTPDLISNHNSLEPHNHATNDIREKQIIQSSDFIVNEIIEQEEIGEFVVEYVENYMPKLEILPSCSEYYNLVDIPEIFASEIIILDTSENYSHFEDPLPEFAKANLVESLFYGEEFVKVTEPIVLKSIMKHMTPDSKKYCSDSSDESFETELPDSLEYHVANQKKVRFNKKKNDRMLKAMSGFLEEATIFMKNMTSVVNKFETKNQFDDCDIEVTVNDISGLPQKKRKRKSKQRRNEQCQTDSYDHFQQQQEVPNECQHCTCNQNLSINKYEVLLEESCKKLEETISKSLASSSYTFDDYDGSYQSFSYNPYDLSADTECNSIESNPVTFSDYGSLPKRHLRRHRPSCSPSAYLRQLTNLRRQVVESSREEFCPRYDE